ncbi:MAG: GAP family protein, partial [Mycobacterium sp.]
MVIGSALVPVQIIITILLLRSPSGKVTAIAWAAGMATVRVVQGAVFGLILHSGRARAADGEHHGYILPTVLLVLAVLMYVLAIRELVHAPEEDAPPPKWMTIADSLSPVKAFLLGAGLLVIEPKFWIFTLGAIAAIGEADLGRTWAIVAFLIFVILASSIHLLLIGVAVCMPRRADALLKAMSDQLTKYSRILVIALGLIFGTWFLIKALTGLGII